jgi:crotonobetainyl-CoA:carnitine CoA-transferase CaiB-like acyl-CoA transferase
MGKALEDIVVLEITSSFWAAAGAGLLADFGARVIRIDLRSSTRYSDVPTAHTALYELANRNKESVALDLSSDAGRAALEDLVRECDVVVADGEQIDYASLTALKPDVIYGRGSGFGPHGPDAGASAFDELAAARTGMMPILPQPGLPPVYTGAGQMNSSVMLALGVMFALWHRAETGEGQEVDVSLLAGNMYGASLDLQAFLAMGGERFLQPVSRLDAGNPMSGTLYPTSDGLWVTLTMPDTDRWWPGLAEIAGLEVDDERFDSHEKRCEENRLLLIEMLEAAFQKQPAAHWCTEFNERQLSADVIEEYSYPANDEQARINRFVIDDNGAKSLGFPLYMSDSEATVRSRAPKPGEHTEQVLREVLGYDDELIRAMRSEGATV